MSAFRAGLLSVLLAWGLLAGPADSAPASAGGKRPNILIIVADDLGYGDVGVYGCRDIPTPHLDGLARQGVRFTSGYVSGPYCSPTRAALMTGRYQQRYGHEFNPGPNGPATLEVGLALKETTLAERLRAAGYATAMVGKWHLGHADKFHPLNRGFQEYFGFLGGAHPYWNGQVAPNNPILRGLKPVEEAEYLTDAFAREALAALERHRREPFFLYLAFNAVHAPLQAPPQYLARFPAIKDPRRRTYAAMLAALDDAVGAVMAKLRAAGLEENTLVFFFSDNGGPPVNGSSNGPLRGYKAQTFEGGIRVPFIVQWKGRLPAGKVYEQPVIQLDILPTVLAAAGVPAPPDTRLDGVNLLPYLQGDRQGPPHTKLYWRFGRQMAIRQGDWKLVWGGNGGPALYNLRRDLGERRDLSRAAPRRFRELQAMWDKWNAELVAPGWGGPPPAAAQSQPRQR